MNDTAHLHPPEILSIIETATKEIGFTAASDYLTGSLLRTLVSAKPGGNFLEMGTGTGLATSWLLDGMDANAKLITVEQDANFIAVAQKYLANDSRVSFHVTDGEVFIRELVVQKQSFDLIFADTWPGKYFVLAETLSLLKIGGIYVIDDMLPQPNWPDDHPPKVAALITALEERNDLQLTKMNWSTGLIIAIKTN